MTVQTMTADRPKLSLPFGRKDMRTQHQPRRSNTLTGEELRRIVSDIIG